MLHGVGCMKNSGLYFQGSEKGVFVCVCVFTCAYVCVYSWPLNNMGLKCAGPLLCGFFSINAVQYCECIFSLRYS